MTTLKEATQRWEHEVEIEAVKLIEEGVEPFEATQRAKSTVRLRRKNAAKETKKP